MTSRAKKLLRRMRETQANWKVHELRALYRGSGFIERTGKGSHINVSHPEFKCLRATIFVVDEVPKYVIREAIRNIDRLIEMEDTLKNCKK